MKVPLLDLRKQYETIKEEVLAAAEEVFDSQQFILGPKVEELEAKVASYCGSKYAVGVSSGTDALLLSLMAAGIGPGDLVITSPYTFFATAGCISRVGATPIFSDIEETTYNMDPDKLEMTVSSLAKAQKAKLRAIMPVHLFGQCAEMGAISEIAKAHDLVVIEDAAQAIGSEYRYGNGTVKRAGSMGDYGCFSFFPSKNLGAFGDGGLVTANDSEVYEKLKIMRVHGAMPKYYHKVIGGNFRLDALQAAILLVKLKHLDEWSEKRAENANLYRMFFEKAGLKKNIVLPLEKQGRHIYNQFVIRVHSKRDDLKTFLNQRGVGCEVYYPVPLHAQECFGYLGHKEFDFPVSFKAAETSLALPIFPELKGEQISYVVDVIKEFSEANF